MTERLALQQFHHRVGDAVRLAEIVNRKDSRMRQCRDREGLTLEARDAIRIRGDGVGENLDGDVALQLRVVCAIDLAHPA
jgi:hypothetical protein